MWRPLLLGRGVAARRSEIRSVFCAARGNAIPLCACNAVYEIHTDVSGVLRHMPGQATCQFCEAQGFTQDATSTHKAYDCPLVRLLLKMVLSAWGAFSPTETWTTDMSLDRWDPVPGTHLAVAAPLSTRARRAIGLGLRPDTQCCHNEAFALVRALVFGELEAFSRATWRAMQEGGEPIAADMYRAATVLYARIRTALQHALEGN